MEGCEHPASAGASLAWGGWASFMCPPCLKRWIVVIISDFKSPSGAPYYANELFGKSHALQKNANKIALQSNKLLSQLAGTQREILLSQKRIEELNSRIAEASERTAAATERQNIIGLAQLSVAETQAAIAAKQLELSNIQALEKRRQVELKQSAYALHETIDGLLGEGPEVRLFYLYDQKFEVDTASVVAEHAEEIADKIYIKDVLKKLASQIGECETSVGQKICADYREYFQKKAAVQDFYNRLNAENSKLSGIVAVGAIDVGDIISRSFNPAFSTKISGKFRMIVLALYYIYGIFIVYGALLYMTEKARLKSSSAASAAQRSIIEGEIKGLQDHIAGFESFFTEFTNSYSLP